LRERAIAIADGRAFVGCRDGWLYAFGIG